MSALRIRSSQKIFTEEEVSGLTGICLEHLQNLARSKHLGFLGRAAEAAGSQAEKWLYTISDLTVLAVLCRRCDH
jgi:hypothetical protein